MRMGKQTNHHLIARQMPKNLMGELANTRTEEHATCTQTQASLEMAHATQKKDQILQNTIAQQFFGININAIANPIYGM